MRKLLTLALLVPLFACAMEEWGNSSFSISPQPKRGVTLLHLAATKGYPKVCRKLIKRDRDVNTRLRFEDYTPLHCACLVRQHPQRRAQVCRVLLSGNTAVNAQDAWGNTALAFAVIDSNPKTCGILLDHGADPALCNHKGNAPLHWAGKIQSFAACRAIITHPPRFPRKEILTVLMIHKFKKDSPFSLIPKDILRNHIFPYVWPYYPFTKNMIPACVEYKLVQLRNLLTMKNDKGETPQELADRRRDCHYTAPVLSPYAVLSSRGLLSPNGWKYRRQGYMFDRKGKPGELYHLLDPDKVRIYRKAIEKNMYALFKTSN